VADISSDVLENLRNVIGIPGCERLASIRLRPTSILDGRVDHDEIGLCGKDGPILTHRLGKRQEDQQRAD
jgi:hypothetical protein